MSASGKWGVVMEGNRATRAMTLTIEPAEVTMRRRGSVANPVKVLGNNFELSEAYDQAAATLASICHKPSRRR